MSPTRGTWLGLLAVAGFAGTAPATRLAVADLSPLFVTSGRALVAVVMAIAVLSMLRPRRPTLSEWAGLTVVAGGTVVGFPLFMAMGVQTAPASYAGVWNGLLPLATAIAGALRVGERPPVRFWLAAIAGSACIVVYAASGQALDGLSIADLWFALAVVSVAIGYAEGGRLARQLGALPVICWALVLSAPLMVLPTWWSWPAGEVSASAWAGFAYAGVVSMFLGFCAWYRAMAIAGVVKISQLQLFQPFITLVISAWLLNEAIPLTGWLVCALVVGCVWFGRRTPLGSPSTTRRSQGAIPERTCHCPRLTASSR